MSSLQSPPAVTAIIPALNEADRIGETIAAIKTIPEVNQILVVDDGSTDNTMSAAVKAGASWVVRFERNRGKGAAMREGIAHAGGDILLFLDADLGSTAAEAGALLGPVLLGQADMTVAVLPPAATRGGMGLALRTARDGIRRATGLEMRAPLSGQRAVQRELLDRLGGLEEGFGVETALTIDAARAGARILEVEVPLRHRETGRDLAGFLHRARQWWDIQRALRKRLRVRQ